MRPLTVARLRRAPGALVRRGRRLLASTAARFSSSPQPPSNQAPSTQPASTQPASTQPAAVTLPDIPVVRRPEAPPSRPDLTVAVILDPFSETAFAPEWTQVRVPRKGWRELLTERRPDLLFAESAWQGNRGAWRYTMSAADAPKPDLRELVQWCRDHGIPTVFWNKEDPPNYERFIETARLFDWVLTVDADCLPRYRADLGHDRVGVLPFAAQPRLHNPVRARRDRPYDVAFAGTFFAEKHPVRREQMETVVRPATEHGVHIYSRMLGDDERYQFPPEYADHVVGSLPYPQMLSAYKAYKVFLNVNSVVDSPSTCARRVFELAACATPVVSGWSAGVEGIFGDTVAVTRDPQQTHDLLTAYLASPELRDRVAHAAYQVVHREHTFGHRVDTVLRAVGLPVTPRERDVTVLVPTRRPGRLDAVLDTVAAQEHRRLQLVVVAHALGVPAAEIRRRAAERGLHDVEVVEADADVPLGECLNRGIAAADGELVAKMDDDNYYAPRYLADLVLPFGYTDAGVVGKYAHYVHLEATDATVLRFADWEHRYAKLVQGGTMVLRRDVATAIGFEPLRRGEDTRFLERCREEGVRIYSADRFNFVSRRQRDPAGHSWQVADVQLLARSSRVVFHGDPVPHVTI